MNYFLFTISLLFIVLFNTKIPDSMGFGKISTIANIPMLIFIGINIFTKKMQYEKTSIFVIIFAIITILFKWSNGQNYISEVIIFLIVPMLISMCFEVLPKKELTLLRNIMLIFYIAECGLAIVEWTLNRHFFFTTGGSEFWINQGFFKSCSLLGSPLLNAQFVAVSMSFIAISDFGKKYFKIILFFLGYVSFFCFNARGSTLVITFITVPYFIWKLNKITPQKKKWLIKVGLLILFSGMIYAVTQTSLGGRLMGGKLMDDSSQTRLEVFQFYKYYQSQDDFLWGNPDNYIYMMNKLGNAGVENGVITLILDYGIILTIPMLILLFRFQYNKLSAFSKLEKWLMLAVFFIIGTMNPNLAAPVLWLMWVLQYYAFRPDIFHQQTR